ncbi:hypothetical protein BpHYR1_047503 [Brachionus plicatilis]|uniref:Uncharacterized protein n=1 Tax=Brachionus plicatilis TaxID=10195 RepID=A0A3M7PNY1_BRAPC|nr:hypothetical protein BpHYR1_047503 [Brachionus plicatilis]
MDKEEKKLSKNAYDLWTTTLANSFIKFDDHRINSRHNNLNFNLKNLKKNENFNEKIEPTNCATRPINETKYLILLNVYKTSTMVFQINFEQNGTVALIHLKRLIRTVETTFCVVTLTPGRSKQTV